MRPSRMALESRTDTSPGRMPRRARLHAEEAEQLVALVAADRVAEIAGRRVQERDGRIGGDRGEVEKGKREQRREEQPDHEPDRPGQDLCRRLAPELALELETAVAVLRPNIPPTT